MMALYGLVELEIVALEDGDPDDYEFSDGKYAVSTYHAVGAIAYEISEFSLEDILSYVNLQLADFVDTSDDAPWIVTTLWAVHYRHYRSTPVSPEDWDTEYEYLGPFNMESLSQFDKRRGVTT